MPLDLTLEVSAVDPLLSVAQRRATALPGQVGTGSGLAPFPPLLPHSTRVGACQSQEGWSTG